MPFDADSWDDEPGATSNDPLPAIPPGELLDVLIESTPGAVRREPQERMVHAVHDAVAAGQHLAVQAGTGTGKSYGYLVGAIATGQRVIVSTATKQLGEQLTGKDAPAVAAAAAQIGRDVTVALLKGRSNYACLKKVEDTRNLGVVEDTLGISTGTENVSEEGEQVRSILEWVSTTTTGDRSEAPVVSDRIWSQFSTDSVNCAGKSCPMRDQCFATLANQAAHEADVVVVNHTLLSHLMALQAQGAKTSLSHFDVLVADEAHELEPAMSRAWSVVVDPDRLARTLDAARRIDGEGKSKKKDAPAEGPAAKRIASAMSSVESLRFALAGLPEGPLPSLPTDVIGLLQQIGNDLLRLSLMAKEKATATKGQPAEAGWVMLNNRLTNAAEDVTRTLNADADESVQWAERAYQPNRTTSPAPKGRGRGRAARTTAPDANGDAAAVLQTAPLTLADRFPDALGDWKLILTSATLAVGGSFRPVLSQLGIDADGIDVGSPFDYPAQMMLYVPPASFPVPAGATRAEHTVAVQDTLRRLVAAAGGRTLGLFTTTQAAKDAAVVLREAFPNLTILAHGDAPMRQLTEQFRDDETSVLLGTRGLWHGLSIDGPSCSAVLIDKIPFPMANDPLMNARSKRADDAGRRGFDEVMVASAGITLAQGVGRLIRTADDRGVVAIMDPRLRTKGYGRTLLRSLPQVRVWDDLSVVEAALRRLTGQPAAA